MTSTVRFKNTSKFNAVKKDIAKIKTEFAKRLAGE